MMMSVKEHKGSGASLDLLALWCLLLPHLLNLLKRVFSAHNVHFQLWSTVAMIVKGCEGMMVGCEGDAGVAP